VQKMDSRTKCAEPFFAPPPLSLKRALLWFLRE
jgi:hypothetical protein